jgi:hypothetical protein
MSEDSEDNTAPAGAPAAKVARKRPTVRKAAKAKSAPEADAAPAPAVVEAPAAAEPKPQRKEDSAPAAERSASAAPAEGGTESHDAGRIAFLVETPAAEPGGNSKKRRRRKKKHGQPGQAGGPPQGGHSQSPAQSHGQPQHPHAVVPHGEAPPSSQQAGEHAQAPAPAMHAAPRPKLDPEQVAKKAWKIFQAEVGEEGLALIDDHDAREISRRCFRLAEIFLEEAARRNR